MNTIERGTRVDVYRNLHNGTWSVRDCQTGRVIAHMDTCSIYDAELVVQPAGRRRVLREGRKNVHAFARGYIHNPAPSWTLLKRYMRKITYNPYKAASFTYADDGGAIHNADIVALGPEGVHVYQHRSDGDPAMVPLDVWRALLEASSQKEIAKAHRRIAN